MYLTVTIVINIINLFACATFIVEDYLTASSCSDEHEATGYSEDLDASECDNPGLKFIEMLEVTFAFIFVIEVFYNLYNQAPPRYLFFLKRDTIIDIVTIVPPLLNLILESKIKIGFLRMLRMLKVMRIIRIFKMLKNTGNKSYDGNNKEGGFYLSPI